MIHLQEIKERYQRINRLNADNETLMQEIKKLIDEASNKKKRRVLTRDALQSIDASINKKRAAIQKNCELIGGAWGEIRTYAISSLLEGGFPNE